MSAALLSKILGFQELPSPCADVGLTHRLDLLHHLLVAHGVVAPLHRLVELVEDAVEELHDLSRRASKGPHRFSKGIRHVWPTALRAAHEILLYGKITRLPRPEFCPHFARR